MHTSGGGRQSLRISERIPDISGDHGRAATRRHVLLIRAVSGRRSAEREPQQGQGSTEVGGVGTEIYEFDAGNVRAGLLVGVALIDGPEQQIITVPGTELDPVAEIGAVSIFPGPQELGNFLGEQPVLRVLQCSGVEVLQVVGQSFALNSGWRAATAAMISTKRPVSRAVPANPVDQPLVNVEFPGTRAGEQLGIGVIFNDVIDLGHQVRIGPMRSQELHQTRQERVSGVHRAVEELDGPTCYPLKRAAFPALARSLTSTSRI